MDRKSKRWEITKVGWQTGLSKIDGTSLKYYINYMTSINHPLSVVAVKAFAWAIAKQVQLRNRSW